MRVDRVVLRDFRGVRGELSLELDAALTVIEAPNGSGKTSVCDGMAWALLGEARRLEMKSTEATERLINAWARGAESAGRAGVELHLGGLRPWRRLVDKTRPVSPDEKKEWLTQSELDAHIFAGGPPAPANLKSSDPRKPWLAAARFFVANEVEVYVDAPDELDKSVVQARRDLLSRLLGVDELLRDKDALAKLQGGVGELLREAKGQRKDAEAQLAKRRGEAGASTGATGQGVDTARLVIRELALAHAVDTEGLGGDLAASVEAAVGKALSALEPRGADLRLLQGADPDDNGPVHDAEAALHAARAALEQRLTRRAHRSLAEARHTALLRARERLPALSALCTAHDDAAAALARSSEAMQGLDRESAARAGDDAAREVQRLEKDLGEVAAWVGELHALWGRRAEAGPAGDCPLCGHPHGDELALSDAVADAAERGLGAAGSALRDALASAQARLASARDRLAHIEAAVAAHKGIEERLNRVIQEWSDACGEVATAEVSLPEQPPSRAALAELEASIPKLIEDAALALALLPDLPQTDDDVQSAVDTSETALNEALDRRTLLQEAWRRLARDEAFSPARLGELLVDHDRRHAALTGEKGRLLEARHTLRSAEALAQVAEAEATLGNKQRYHSALERRSIALSDAVNQRVADSDRIADARLEALRGPIEALYRRNCLASVWQSVRATSIAGSVGLDVRHDKDTPNPLHLKDLSAGQRQDLALAVFLTQARQLGGTFVLDDPFLHLDGWNRLSYLDVLRTMVLESRLPGAVPLRFIVTTANSDLARLFQEKFHLVPAGSDGGPVFRQYRLSGDPRDGTYAHPLMQIPPPPS